MALPVYTQGDYITCILDMDARTISFGKNGDEPKLAFEDVDATEVYPCVMFYSSNPGEKVKTFLKYIIVFILFWPHLTKLLMYCYGFVCCR